jgi:hypothetical protein
MEVQLDRERLFEVLDVLLARWSSSPKQYPFTHKDATIPQTIIPDALRSDPHKLARFYFYACIYMRGGIESSQAFRALLTMGQEHPELFDSLHAQWMKEEEVQNILKRFIGWDSKAASINWIENSKRLMRNWDGDPFKLIKGVKSYTEALRRIKNKRGKDEFKKAGSNNIGFRGFQPKMVSMLLYFYDWEGWLKPRFPYPSPADFHNFRIGFANRILRVSPPTAVFRTQEKISAVWRAGIMDYLQVRKADPVKVADALWLFSLVMCGNSPATTTYKTPPIEKKERPALFHFGNVTEHWKQDESLQTSRREKLLETCGICLCAATCDFAIPAYPYYTLGQLELRPREKVTRGVILKFGAPPSKEEPLQETFDFGL